MFCSSEHFPFVSTVLDLVYWKDVGKTGLVFTGMVVGFAFLFQYSAITLLSNLGLCIMAFTLPVRLLFRTMDLVRLNDGTHPFQYVNHYQNLKGWGTELFTTTISNRGNTNINLLLSFTFVVMGLGTFGTLLLSCLPRYLIQ